MACCGCGDHFSKGVYCTGRMKVNLRRFEDMKIRLKKSSKMKHLREGISRTDLQIFISSKIIQEFIFKSSYLRRFLGKAIFASSIFMKAEHLKIYSKIYVKIISYSKLLSYGEKKRKLKLRSRVFSINSVQGFFN